MSKVIPKILNHRRIVILMMIARTTTQNNRHLCRKLNNKRMQLRQSKSKSLLRMNRRPLQKYRLNNLILKNKPIKSVKLSKKIWEIKQKPKRRWMWSKNKSKLSKKLNNKLNRLRNPLKARMRPKQQMQPKVPAVNQLFKTNSIKMHLNQPSRMPPKLIHHLETRPWPQQSQLLRMLQQWLLLVWRCK